MAPSPPRPPPLEPGGSYWDTAFLRTALTTLQRRKPELVRGGLALSAYAWMPLRLRSARISKSASFE